MQVEGRSHMRPVIEKELLHYDILFALDKENLLDQLTFQGGTLLRLCYGAPRFSEDLDFTGGKNFTASNLKDIKECLESYIGKRYGLEIEVKEPHKHLISENNNLHVDKWQLSITTMPGHKDLPKQKIKIEVINVPSYSREPKTLRINYDFLPDSYGDIFILCESLDEVYADKIISLVNCNKYIRFRDIWDLRWLTQQRATLNKTFILNKIQDYSITDYTKKLDNLIPQLKAIIHSAAFREQMSRFLPLDIQQRTLMKEHFFDNLTSESVALFEQVRSLL